MIAAIVMLLSLLPQGIITVSAAITATRPTVGDGTANNPYQIGTAAELYWFADYVNNGNTSANAVLTGNITVNTGVLTDEGYFNSSNKDNFTSWTPIGNDSTPYTGTFDGQGHTVSGLYFYDNKAYVGLFGYVESGGRVSGVGVVDFYFRGYDYIGGVCGANYGTIENCYNAGFLTSPTYGYIGGVCGANYDTIKNCYNIGKVLLNGVCGYNGPSGIIENCYNAGTVSGRGDSAYGVCRDNRNTIKNCYYLDTTGNDRYAKAKTVEAFASGEVAYLLQNGQEADENGNIPEVWGQTIGTDTYPVLGGAKVYQVVAYAGCESKPGNEKLVNKIVNELLKKGVTLLNDAVADVHVSGHACQEELKLILSLVKPKYFIPIHGEYRHLKAHSDLAQEMGVDRSNIVIPELGMVIEVSESGIRTQDHVQAGKVLIDGLGVGDVGSVVLRDRRHLAQDGLIVVVATISFETKEILSGPDIVSRGFVYVKEAEELMDSLRGIALETIEKCFDSNIDEWNTIKGRIKDALTTHIYGITKRKPMILPVIMEV